MEPNDHWSHRGKIDVCVRARTTNLGNRKRGQEARGWYLYGILLCDRGEHAHVLLPILDVLPHYLVYVLYLLNR
jgi:hypothetical protein